MTSKSSLAAKRAIQEMGASLFYAKLRGEDIATYGNIPSEENIASNEKLDGQDKVGGSGELSIAENLSGEEELSNEEIITSDKTLATNETIGSKESIGGNESMSTEENISNYENLKLKGFSNKEKIAGEKKLVSYGNLAISKKIYSEENIASEVKLVSSGNFGSEVKRTGKGKLMDRMPIPYESPLLTFITELGLSGACFAIVLRHILPAEGGKIRIGALSRSLNMSSNNIRLHLETLQTKGVIASSNGDQQGRMIRFLHPFLCSQCGVDFFSESTDGDFHQRLGEQAH